MESMKSQILWQYSDILHLYTFRENYVIKIKWSEEKRNGCKSAASESKFSEGVNAFFLETKQTKPISREHKEWAIK